MFQQLKSAINSRIAEEQARAKANIPAPTRTPSTARRSAARRTDSPSQRPKEKPKGTEDGGRGTDPSVFESAFVIEDDSEEPSRAGTPAPPETKTEKMSENGNNDETTREDEASGVTEKLNDVPKPSTIVELPLDVRTKLRKLEKLEARYQELLRSYRIAHARAVSIEPFEKTLKENTPLLTISEPGAFVEYLNQLTLKGDMVMDELKRVTSDRDDYKKKFEEAQMQASTAKEELSGLKSSSTNSPSVEATEAVPRPSSDARRTSAELKPSSIRSPVSSVLGMFSPKQAPQGVPEEISDANESFFSYDEEIPKLQSDLQAKSVEVEQLKENAKTLQESLVTANEINESLNDRVQSLEQELGEAKDSGKEVTRLAETQELQQKLKISNTTIIDLEAKLGEQKKQAQNTLESKASELHESKDSAKRLNDQLRELRFSNEADQLKVQQLEEQVESFTHKIEILNAPKETNNVFAKAEQATPTEISIPASGSSKKKNKKKKKGTNATKDSLLTKTDDADEEAEAPLDSSIAANLDTVISTLKGEIATRDLKIEELQSRRKTEEDLQEEIENMRESLLNIGQEHVEAKEKIKELKAEKAALQEKIDNLEKGITTYQNQSKLANKLEEDLSKVASEYENLKMKYGSLQTDLGAAQQLATSRYKDLTDLKDVLQKAQPELKTLRSENAILRTTKDELTGRTAELRRLEGREKDLRADLAIFKKQAADRENDIRGLNEKVTQELNGRLKAEDQARIAGRDLRRVEADKIELAATGEKAQRELSKIQDEVTRLRSVVQELEVQVSKLTSDNQGLREEINLKTSQYSSVQSLVSSMRDQTSEMATQLKEAKEQAESLEEELGEVQRLLNERTREGETMRRLLSDVDERADSKVREMRERMEGAIEERDRAEDEAATNGRRRAREMEDLKNKIRDMERELKRAIDDRDEMQHSEKEWKRRREDLEKSSERATQEVVDINKAMDELRDALDESEKQARDAEKQRTDLRRVLDEANQKYDRLQKSLKVKQQRLDELTSINSSRSSLERDSSPNRPSNGAVNGTMDYVYLKTILLQFFEQRDKKLQAQLVPVLGRLLHFDKKDEQKWITAISVK